MKYVKKFNRTSWEVLGNFQKIWTFFSWPFSPKCTKMAPKAVFHHILILCYYVSLKVVVKSWNILKNLIVLVERFLGTFKKFGYFSVGVLPQKVRKWHRKLFFIIFGYYAIMLVLKLSLSHEMLQKVKS